MAEQERVDAATYAAHLERLDRIGREALAADPAEAITLVREANELVGQLLPMHRRLMEELAHHRQALQAACDELAAEPADATAADGDGDGERSGAAEQRLAGGRRRRRSRRPVLTGFGSDRLRSRGRSDAGCALVAMPPIPVAVWVRLPARPAD